MSSQEIEQAVAQILTDAQVNYDVKYVAEVTKDDWGSPQQVDMWRYSFYKHGFTHKCDGDFFTGLGHRKAPVHSGKNPFTPQTISHAAWDKEHLKPVKPSATSVLYNLVLDAEAINTSFNYWCADYGYDNDSMKALRIYQACCESGEKLRKLFDSDTLRQLQELLQEY